MKKLLASAAIAAALFSPMSASAEAMPTIVPGLDWNTSINHFQIDSDKFIGQRLTVECPRRTVRDVDEVVHGSGIYSSDAPICVAAVHAGALTPDGGVVTLQVNPGADHYDGTLQNGVASNDRPATERSIVFINGDNPEADAIRSDYMPQLKWDTKFTATGLANHDLVGQRFAFNCPEAPAGIRHRKVTGTDRYAFASRVCTAAVHAGAITPEGGPVLVQMDPGVAKLVGSMRNGIETDNGPGGTRTLIFVDTSTQAAEL